ncbi:MAG: YDG domain-containing protein, partial [Clostridia bacterium]
MKRYVSGLVIMSILLALCAGNAWAAGAAGEKGGRSAEAVTSGGAWGARVSEGREADAIRIEGEIEADSEIVLEGKAIRLSGTGVIRRAAGFEGSLFTISGGSLTIADGVTLSGANAAGVTSALVSVRGGELILQAGGALQGNAGGGVYVGSGGFAMRGGRISGNRGRASGVRMVSGTFEMTGGDIVENGGVACSYGGGVRVSGGTFTMRGGRIAENEAQSYGGGVYVGGGTAHMHGGCIAQNRAGSYGGGVYAGGGTFAVSDGVITKNEARSYGGGVYVGGGTFAVSGGARVEGNASGAAQVGNVYLASGRTITISGALNGAHLGVRVARGRVGSLISGEFEGAWATEAHFTGDNPAYAIAHVQDANGKATLRLKAGKPNAPLIRVQPVAPAPTSYAGVSGRLSIVSERAPLNGGERLVYAWHKSVTGSINASDAVVGACATYDLPPGLAAGTHYYYCRVTASQGGAPSSGAVNSTVVAVRVLPRSIADATLEVASAIYIGAPILPRITVTDGPITLVEGVDYAVRHENNTLAASAASEKPPTVTISGLRNYDPATQRTQSFTIDKAEIRVNGGKICAKAYDGSADARVEALTFEGLAGNEMLTIGIDYTAGAPAFDSARAGHGDKIVTGTAALVAGGKADNYRLSGAYRLTGASIAPRLAVLRWSGIATRTYDASAASVGATVENPVAGEHCGVFVTGGDAKNAGTHTATAGLDNGNYALSENAAQRYVIEKAVLTPRIGTKGGPVARAYRPNDKTFEGAAIELSGAVAGEHPAATARIEFVDADAGSDKPANARDIRLGDWSANYALSSDAIAGQRVRGACVFAASQAAPGAPTCLSRTATRVALNAVEGASYRCGGAGAQDASGAWQRAPVFEGLVPGTAYAFCAYYPEKPNYRASDAGAKAIFYTC